MPSNTSPMRPARLAVSAVVTLGLAIGPVASQRAEAQEFLEENRTAITIGLLGAAGVTLLVMTVVKKRQAAKERAEQQRIEAEQAAEAQRIKELNTLAGKDVQGLNLSLGEGTAAPGGAVALIASATLADGSELLTVGAGGGQTQWSDYVVDVQGGEFSAGNVEPAGDPRSIDDHRVVVTVTNAHDPQDTAELVVDMQYNVRFNAGFSGYSGPTGDWGREGQAGREGSGDGDGDGGPGGSGGDGGDGQRGGSGEHGSNVLVQARAVQDQALERPMLQVLVENTDSGSSWRYLIDPEGGTLHITAHGGDGGSGGPGGRGGYGGRGGRGANPGSGGDAYQGHGGDGGAGGDGGNGGDGGDGGDGGTITLVLDPSAAPYEQVFKTGNQGGRGGSAGSRGSYGSAGVGGTAYRSGQQGQQGQDGTYGQVGQPGRNGPKPVTRVEAVEFDW